MCCAGALGDAVTLKGWLRSDARADSVRLAEGYKANAKDVILKAASALAEIHAHMILKEPIPETLEGVADVFRAEPSPLTEYSHTQTVVGSQMTLALAAAHEIPEADLQRVTSSFPTNADRT
jgi:hypothetical protein